jgi:OOP family OmpA-OmpF porin
MQTPVPPEFAQTEALINKAEASRGAKYCPVKVTQAKELGEKAVEAYVQCKHAEALALLAQARKLAEDAMMCTPGVPPAKPKDSDGDGVYDDKDKCPNTPRGVKVDSVGCPLDSDGDGVFDYKDDCPGTPKGADVNSKGCWALGTVYFDTDKDIIKSQYKPMLDEVAAVMKKNPNLGLGVDGHTDNQGLVNYNQGLSDRRVNAVRNYLIKKGVPKNRLVGKGYGMKKPAVANTSRSNMAKNRRVELLPIK